MDIQDVWAVTGLVSSFFILIFWVYPEFNDISRNAIRRFFYWCSWLWYTFFNYAYFFYLTHKIKNLDKAERKDREKHFNLYLGQGIEICYYESKIYKDCINCKLSKKVKFVRITGNRGYELIEYVCKCGRPIKRYIVDVKRHYKLDKFR
jgi:hypothetical protein